MTRDLQPISRQPLGSRSYVETVIFAQRRQQEFALMSLLAIARHHAWRYFLQLAQLYHYAILPILSSSEIEEEAEMQLLEQSLLDCGARLLGPLHPLFVQVEPCEASSRAGHGAARRRVAVDFQWSKYRFNAPWRDLFGEVQRYLSAPTTAITTTTDDDESGATAVAAAEPHFNWTPATTSMIVDEADAPPASAAADGAEASASPSGGSVGVVATLLHAMELFERQRPLQLAIEDTRKWILWYWYVYRPTMQQVLSPSSQSLTDSSAAATSASSRAALAMQLFNLSLSPATTTAAGPVTCGACDGASSTDYVPMNWLYAGSPAQREAVLSYRRQLRVAEMEKSGAERHPISPVTTIESAGSPCVSSAAFSTEYDTDEAEADGFARVVKDAADSIFESEAAVGAGGVDAAATDSAYSGGTAAAEEAKKGELDEAEDSASDSEDAMPDPAGRILTAGCFGISFFSIFD